jgi:hypothetical protein
MDIEKLSVEELKRGYTFDEASNSYICHTCKQVYEAGEIYNVGKRQFEAARAIREHVEMEHGDSLKQLIYSESKYNTLTDNQKELLLMMYSGLSDKDIALKLGISASTVRHQRFMFRERAKQAKMYLAIYELAAEKNSNTDEKFVPVSSNAVMVDERFEITEKEREQILEAEFESLSPLKLKRFPGKEKKKIVILMKIAEQFNYGTKYNEKELNDIIKEIYEDFAVIRRYMIMYGFMDRTPDGKSYWLK